MMRTLLVVSLQAFSAFTLAQDSLVFVPTWGSEALVLGSSYRLSTGAEVRVERLRLYVGVPVAEGFTYRLLDAEHPERMVVYIPSLTERILLGVDSATNVSGAFGGDLDPTNGMYWTWQSGYINVKVEGRSSAAPGGVFELHLGGYAAPHATAQWVELPVRTGRCAIDLQRLMETVDLTGHANVMSPGPEAVRLSRAAATMFRPDAP